MVEKMERDEAIRQLKARHDFWSGARYVVEEFCAPLAGFETGFLSHCIWHHWWLSVIVGIAAWFALARYIGSLEEAAEDAHDRAAGEGRYWQSDRSNAVE